MGLTHVAGTWPGLAFNLPPHRRPRRWGAETQRIRTPTGAATMAIPDHLELKCPEAQTWTMDASVARRFTSPFAPLELSSTSAAELEALAEKFAARSISTFERFHMDSNGKVDESRWKFLSEKGKVRAYAELPSPSATHDQNASIYADTLVSELPVVLVAGSISGDLDDVMYGVVSPTIDMMRFKSSYVHDEIVCGSVLASLVGPTHEDPFHSISIKWVEIDQPLPIRAVVKNRDYVFMEATGMERLRNGERVGYHLVHSVQFPETPARQSAIRGNMSVSVVYCQRDNNTTDVFLKGFLNPAGGLMRSIVIRSATRSLLSIANNVACCRMRKLMWALRHRHGFQPEDGHREKPCVYCGKKQSMLVTAVSHSSRAAKRLQRRRHCQLCRSYVCPNCRRQHQLSFLQADSRLTQHQITICQGCEREAFAANPRRILRAELQNTSPSFYHWSDEYDTSSRS